MAFREPVLDRGEDRIAVLTQRPRERLECSQLVALFQPFRSRIQGAVNRRFYRSRYDATARSMPSACGCATR